MRDARRLALAALLVQTVVAAGTYPATKNALLDAGAVELAMMRFAGTALVFGVHLGLVLRSFPARSEIGPLLLLGFLAVPGNQLLFLLGLNLSTPSHAALCYALTPVAVALVERVARGVVHSTRTWIGIGIAIGGTAILLTRPGSGFAPSPLRGDLLLLLAMVSWALYTILCKRMVERRGAVWTTGWSLVFGAGMALPFGVGALAHAPYSHYPFSVWFGLAYLVLGTSVLCYALWNYALGKLPTTRVAVFANLQPPTASLLSYLFFGERIGLLLVAGGTLVVGGVLLTQTGSVARAGLREDSSTGAGG